MFGKGFASMGCWHRAYMDVFTASFDGHPGAEFRSTIGIPSVFYIGKKREQMLPFL
ncbi:hypothetical protein [Methylicorpusculum sp.]|uniref:hypothetical protein n=1 Tax=Methylicorpusculum sp. TaxID=2713644 RepID=UPI00272CCCE9|nr:hypothetical protein [Methylicorpusculum sp.]